jgi:hypothetical protein
MADIPRPAALTRALPGVLLIALATIAPPTSAEPRWSIERPIAKGKPSPLAAAPLQKEAAHDKELAERYPVTIERIDVEGVRDPDARREPPRTTEQRFAERLNEGSPELVAGRSYDGYYYDGTLFWGSDPLSFAWKNLTHWLSR